MSKKDKSNDPVDMEEMRAVGKTAGEELKFVLRDALARGKTERRNFSLAVFREDNQIVGLHLWVRSCYGFRKKRCILF